MLWESPSRTESPRPQGNLLTQLVTDALFLSPHSLPVLPEFSTNHLRWMLAPEAEDLGCLSRRSVMSGPFADGETQREWPE